MSEFISRLIGILLFRNGPQDMPAGVAALCLGIALYVLSTVLNFTLGTPPERPVAVMALAIVLPLILVRIVLGVRGVPARWVQTTTALFGTGALMSLMSLPLAANGNREPTALLVITSLIVFLWSLAVDAHIWRRALETSFAAGLAVAVILFALSISIINSIAGPL